MISMLDFKAHCLRVFFNAIGRLGGSVLNIGVTRDMDVFSNLRYGREPEQRLDILRLKAAKGDRLPLLVYFHGGGWISADKKIYEGIAATFSRNGFLTFNVNYRLAPKSRFLAQLQDATHAVDWIYRNAARYGGDRSAIILAGDSAGAQIASWYASALQSKSLFQESGIQTDASKVSVAGLLLFYGVYDFDTLLDARFPFIKIFARSFLGADSQTYAKNSKLASPIRQVSHDLPPIWLCAGERDGLFTQSKAYAEALTDSGACCQTLFLSGECQANHGFLFFRWLRSSKMAIAASLEFLSKLVETGGKGGRSRGSDY